MPVTASQRRGVPVVPSASSATGPPASTWWARPSPTWPAPIRNTSGATQVGAWTPLVTEVIGTSAGSKPGQSPENISRLTAPCRVETPLARWASRSPITAMLNSSGSPPG